MKSDAAEMLIMKAAWLRDNGMDQIKAASQAKLFASTAASDITRQAVQIHGGYGYIKEYPVERYFRDARVTELYEGTTEAQRRVISRDLLKD